jgi:hypothetical protein
MLASARPTRRDALTVSIASRASRGDTPHRRRLTADAHSWRRDRVGRCRVLAEVRHGRGEAQRSGKQIVRPGCQRPRRREIVVG